MENNPIPENLTKQIKIREDATVVSGSTSHGKNCKLVDNTKTIAKDELEQLLKTMIENQNFGIHAMSSSDGIINIDKPELSHIQINDDLYRLYLFRYHAIIEKF